MEYLRIVNWDKYQQCDRNAPWIKLYTSLLQKYEFLNQTDSFKASLLCIWMYAGTAGNKIPGDGKLLGSLFCLDGEVKIDALVDAGFLEPFDEAEHLQSVGIKQDKIAKRKEKDKLKKRSESDL